MPPDPAGRAADALPVGLLDRVRRRLAADGTPPTPSAVAAALRREGGALQGDAAVLAALRLLQAELSGAGPLEPLLAEPDVTDVLVNGPREVWVDRGDGLVPAGISFPDEVAVRRLAQRLAAAAGRRLDDAQPWVDARLADGTRLHAVLPPVSPTGTTLSLRVPRARAFTPDQLVAAGTLCPEAAALVSRVVAARLSFLVTGGTGSGKTTLLGALLGQVDPRERLLLVEDAGELVPDHPHVVRLQARPPNSEGAGAVLLTDLVRQALRMRPDRVVVGEVRGAEVVDLLAALNTGHEGGCGTLHANGVADVPARLEALGVTAGLPRAAVHSQVAAGLDVVLHLRRGADGVRRLVEVGVLLPGEDGLVTAAPAYALVGAAWRAEPAAERLEERLRGRSGAAGQRPVPTGPVPTGPLPTCRVPAGPVPDAGAA